MDGEGYFFYGADSDYSYEDSVEDSVEDAAEGSNDGGSKKGGSSVGHQNGSEVSISLMPLIGSYVATLFLGLVLYIVAHSLGLHSRMGCRARHATLTDKTTSPAMVVFRSVGSKVEPMGDASPPPPPRPQLDSC